ncbi:MAG: flavin reductase family protein [Chroococcidiopsidaceae cyanobacterium CP_BM_ER_R8_30]|nr:flavin reductase family protein [Chroococcidiopsidaceae cyanobacterium CP_BM_ER_R8_30]
MELDLRQLSNHDRYKLLTSVVVPRPIALVTTINQEGQHNAAPYSFFNAMGSDPPVVVIGVGNRQPGEPKDTAHNIRFTREFVVNLVNEPIAEQMNITAIDFPPEIDDLAMAGLTPVPSVRVQAPRIAESPVNLECREIATLNIGQTRVVVGEVLHIQIKDEFVDPVKLHIHTEQLRAVGRMHGGGWYVKTTDLFQLDRITYKEWQTKPHHTS